MSSRNYPRFALGIFTCLFASLMLACSHELTPSGPAATPGLPSTQRSATPFPSPTLEALATKQPFTLTPSPNFLPTQWRFQMTSVANLSFREFYEGLKPVAGEGSGPLTDGRLLLIIEEVEGKCHSRNEEIKMRFTLYNLSDGPLVFQSNLVIGEDRLGWNGNLAPWLSRADETPVRTIFDLAPYVAIDRWPRLPDENLQTLPAHTMYETVLAYSFPEDILKNNVSGQGEVTPTPGLYQLRFAYQYIWLDEDHTQPDNLWTGQIASNRIELCLTDVGRN